MKRISREKLMKIFIASIILSVLCVIAMIVSSMKIADYQSSGIQVNIFLLLGSMIIGLPSATIGFMGIILNVKKLFLGLIYPIPILSYIIEAFKCVIIGIRAFICIIKRQPELVIGKSKENVNSDD